MACLQAANGGATVFITLLQLLPGQLCPGQPCCHSGTYMRNHTLASQSPKGAQYQRNTALHRLAKRLTLFILFFTTNAFAQVGGGLKKTTSFLQMIESEIHIIVPILAIIGGLLIVGLYMNDLIRKDTLIQWFIGLIIATVIVEVVAFVF